MNILTFDIEEWFLEKNYFGAKESRYAEYDRLLEVNDNYPKYLLRTDDFAGGNYKGIKTMHVADFLLSEEY